MLVLTAASNLFAQGNPPSSLGGLALSETSVLNSTPDLAVWRNLHPAERLKNAGYDNEYESQGLWCAASLAEFAFAGVKGTREAFFYAPPSKPGDPLAGRQDPALPRQCRLLALWYQVDDPASPSELAKAVFADLSASLDRPRTRTHPLTREPTVGGGTLEPYKVWERGNLRIVLAVMSAASALLSNASASSPSMGNEAAPTFAEIRISEVPISKGCENVSRSRASIFSSRADPPFSA